MRFAHSAACASRRGGHRERGEGRASRRSHPRRCGGVNRRSVADPHTPAWEKPARTRMTYFRRSDRCRVKRCPRDRGSPGARARACANRQSAASNRSEEHTSELQSQSNLVCRLLLEKKKYNDRSELAVVIKRFLKTMRAVPDYNVHIIVDGPLAATANIALISYTHHAVHRALLCAVL